MASSSGASMNASASGVAVTATSQPAACASFTRSWTLAAGGAAQTTTYSVPRGACSPIRVTSLTVSDEAVISSMAHAAVPLYRMAFGGASQRAASSSAAARSWAGWKCA